MESEQIEQTEFQANEKLIATVIKKSEELKTKNKLTRLIPIIVEGDEMDKDESYVIYLKRPSFADFSKFQTLGKQNEMQALRQLARDCFVDGDMELIDDDDMFMYGLMPNMSSIINFRRSQIVDLSKAGK